MALALHQGGFSRDQIALFDRDGEPAAGDQRILALNAGSRHLLEALEIWPLLVEHAFPMRSIALTDSALNEEVRPVLLGFSAERDAPLAHLVPLGRLRAALQAKCRAVGIEVHAAAFRRATPRGGRISVSLSDRTIEAELLVAADGARSAIRADAGIPFHGWSYDQMAITAIVRHSGEHRGEAIQHFLPGGPFALLPLAEGASSLVWSAPARRARDLLEAGPALRRREIAERAAGARGEILEVEAMSAHPLALGLARRYFAARRVLIADAAHQVHPLAGQGLNLGFEDAATLAELLVDRARIGLDIGAPDLLEAYQAARRPPAVAMAYATDGLNRLFSSDWGPLRLARDIGLGLVARAPGLRRGFMALAAGETGRAPRLFRGEAL